MVNVYYDKDANLSIIKNKKIVVFGYGNQGHAHALNLRDSGCDVAVSLCKGSSSITKAKEVGFKVFEDNAEAAKTADLAVILIPDEKQKELYEKDLKDNLPQGTTLVFGHGFSVHFKCIQLRSDMNVVLVAPKGPGYSLRKQYDEGKGLACLMAVEQDNSGKAKDVALAYASAIGCGRAGVIETTFKNETETDLFGEQAVLCGGVIDLIRSAFEVLVKAGYPPELAYYECLHEVKFIVDLVHEKGIAGMRSSISNTAEYGGFIAGPKLIDNNVKSKMKELLQNIQSGAFAKEWMAEHESSNEKLGRLRQEGENHFIEKIGKKLRNP